MIPFIRELGSLHESDELSIFRVPFLISPETVKGLGIYAGSEPHPAASQIVALGESVNTIGGSIFFQRHRHVQRAVFS